MHQAGRSLAVAAALFLAGCGSEDTQPAAEAKEALVKEGNIGSVRFSYDARLLLPANVEIAVPPDGTTSFGTKLLPARELPEHDSHVCFGAGGEAHPCTVEEEPGLTFALLERPFETYAEAMQETIATQAIGETKIDGQRGLRLDAGKEGGLDVVYTIIPVDGRALLIKLQSDGETVREDGAIAAVIASLDLPG